METSFRFLGMLRKVMVCSAAMWISTGHVVTKAADPADLGSSSDVEFFESKIRPVLHEHCYSCHSSEAKIVRGGLLLDSHDGMRQGGDSGPAVVPGDAEESLIVQSMMHEAMEMPPRGKLPDEVIADFARWIDRGAFDPRQEVTQGPGRSETAMERGDHWSFQPIAQPRVPQSAATWVESPIDAFVWNRLNQRGWQPASETDKYTLIRRATFDLIGLPPSESEINAFLADNSPGSFARVVDRLLASPHYGQRWGRHWLDLVRYADTNGADENHSMPNAWRYRDWVFHALNHDLPFDQFITQQLAGDLLPVPDDETAAGDLITATGMLVIGPKMLAEQDKEKMRIDIVDEQIDTVSRTMLGMTIACARCHDHKFDPIRSEDYYALAGIFASTRTMLNQDFVSKWMERDLPSTRISQLRKQHQFKIDAARKEVDAIVSEGKHTEAKHSETDAKTPEKPESDFDDATKKRLVAAREKLAAIEKSMPAFESAMAVTEGETHDVPVHLRGNHLQKADRATSRGVPQLFHDIVPLTSIPGDHSGRLELAAWLTSPDHPLTARVMANRLWMWHFGQPLMQAPSNFGFQSPPPLYQDLLDYLARTLIDDGWSLKRAHRMILLSKTYRMTSRSVTHESSDPGNEYLWRQNRRRLEVEPMRDAIQVAGDSLDRSFSGAPVNENSPRRTVYLTINRAALLELFSTFDYIETANHIERRPVTIVPGQALYLMNHSLVHLQAERLARQVSAETNAGADRVFRIWLRLHGRPPSDDEIQIALKFVEEAKRHSSDVNSSDVAKREQTAWSSLCRTLIAGSSFNHVE